MDARLARHLRYAFPVGGRRRCLVATWVFTYLVGSPAPLVYIIKVTTVKVLNYYTQLYWTEILASIWPQELRKEASGVASWIFCCLAWDMLLVRVLFPTIIFFHIEKVFKKKIYYFIFLLRLLSKIFHLIWRNNDLNS